MSEKQEILELEILKFFKQSLIKYIDIERHSGFQSRFSQNPTYSADEIRQALNTLLAQKDLVLSGRLLRLSEQGSDKTCLIQK